TEAKTRSMELVSIPCGSRRSRFNVANSCEAAIRVHDGERVGREQASVAVPLRPESPAVCAFSRAQDASITPSVVRLQTLQQIWAPIGRSPSFAGFRGPRRRPPRSPPPPSPDRSALGRHLPPSRCARREAADAFRSLLRERQLAGHCVKPRRQALQFVAGAQVDLMIET